MTLSINFLRVFFTALSFLLSVSCSIQYFGGTPSLLSIAIGLVVGLFVSLTFIVLDTLGKNIKIRLFNSATLGLFFGFLMAKTILFLVKGVTGLSVSDEIMIPLQYLIYLSCAYLGLIITIRSSDEICACIPFIDFKSSTPKRKDILADSSVLQDPRIIDLASTGLLDNQLIFPRFAIKELYLQAEHEDESIKIRARKGLDVLKKLESMPSLELRYVEFDFPEIKEPMVKLVRLARSMDANIITSDMTRIQQSSIEGVVIINIHLLSQALKPMANAGETISIKIQRYGKEPRQGVGYLDDGTMVVVNGAAKYIDETIKATVFVCKANSFRKDDIL